LAVGVLRKADAAGFGDTFQSCGDVDAVAHEIAVAFLDDVAEMNADPKLDAPLWRQPGIALDHAVLHFDGATHRIDHAAELDKVAVAGPLHHAAMMHGDGGVE
jgi:hypothetical protein